MINYEPTGSYEDDVSLIESLRENSSELKNISISDDFETEDEGIFREIKSANKDIEFYASNFSSLADDLEIKISDKIQCEFNDKVNTYTYLVENGIEKDNFPFSSWTRIFDINTYHRWVPNDIWMKANDFPTTNITSQYLYITNSADLIKAVQHYNESSIKPFLISIKEKYFNNSDFRPELKNIYDYFIFGEINNIYKLFQDSEIDNTNIPSINIPKLENKKWTFLAGIEVSANWGNEEYKEEILLLLKDGTEENKKEFVEKVLLNNFNSPFLSFVTNHSSFNNKKTYSLKSINWDLVQDFLNINKKLDLKLEEEFFDKMNKLITNNIKSIKEEGSIEKFEYIKLNYSLSNKTGKKNNLNKI